MADPVVTVAEARRQLREWMSALEACSSGANYSIAGRSLSRQDVATIRAEIQRWHNTVLALEAINDGNSRPLGASATFPAPGSGSGPGGIVGTATWTDWRS